MQVPSHLDEMEQPGQSVEDYTRKRQRGHPSSSGVVGAPSPSQLAEPDLPLLSIASPGSAYHHQHHHHTSSEVQRGSPAVNSGTSATSPTQVGPGASLGHSSNQLAYLVDQVEVEVASDANSAGINNGGNNKLTDLADASKRLKAYHVTSAETAGHQLTHEMGELIANVPTSIISEDVLVEPLPVGITPPSQAIAAGAVVGNGGMGGVVGDGGDVKLILNELAAIERRRKEILDQLTYLEQHAPHLTLFSTEGYRAYRANLEFRKNLGIGTGPILASPSGSSSPPPSTSTSMSSLASSSSSPSMRKERKSTGRTSLSSTTRLARRTKARNLVTELARMVTQLTGEALARVPVGQQKLKGINKNKLWQLFDILVNTQLPADEKLTRSSGNVLILSL